MTVGFVFNIAYSLYSLVFNHIGNRLYEKSFIDLIRKLRHDDSFASAVVEFFYIGFGAQNKAALTGFISLFNARSAHQNAARGIIGSVNIFHKLFYRNFGIIEHRDTRV